MASNDESERGGRHEARLFGAPEPRRFRDTLEGRALSYSAAIHFDSEAEQDRLLAIEKVALDIFDNPAAARAFAVNPEAYLKRAGIEGVEVDLNSPEVRVAMAMGDPEVRTAAQRGDVEGFIDAIRAQGIDTHEPLSPVAAFEIAAMLSAVAVTWAAVGYSVYAGMMVRTGAAFWTSVTVRGVEPFVAQDHANLIRQLAEQVGGSEFAQIVGRRAVERVLEEYANLHEQAPELLSEFAPRGEERS